MKKIYILGLGARKEDITGSVSSIINNADVIVGGQRFIEQFSDVKGEKIVIRAPIERVIYNIKELSQRDKKVVVLSDGDPLFFGIGKRLIREIGKDNLEIIPGTTTVQMACARLKIPWEDMKIVSIHGRDGVWHLLQAISFYNLIGIYTGGSDGPHIISDMLIQRHVDDFSMLVFEDLGLNSERIRNFKLKTDIKDIKEADFSPLNFVILKRDKPLEITPCIGLDDNYYLHEKGLITKKEIRAVGISLLELKQNNILWDLGAGCGAVSIESAHLIREGMVFAIEKSRERIEQIKKNRKRFGVYHIEVIHGTMPECLSSLPAPDRVFLGGGLSMGDELLNKIFSRLRPGGRFVAHTVLLRSFLMLKGFFDKHNIPYQVTLLQVSRSKELLGDIRLSSLNPVFIISATRPSINGDNGDIGE